MIRYPSVEDVVALNRELAGGAGGVRDQGVVESAVYRPQQAFGESEAHPTLWAKAAALLHGLAATQGFHDGNKRTAWVATEVFLEANGAALRDVPDIEAEAFVIAVATTAWTDRTLEKAAEWLALQSEPDPWCRHPQLHFATLAQGAAANDDGTYSILNGDLTGMAVGAVPFAVPLWVACRVFWTPKDEGRPHTLAAEVFAEGSDEPSGMNSLALNPPLRGGHAHHPHGLMPTACALGLVVLISQPGNHRVVLTLDGSPLARLPFTVVVSDLMA